MLRAFLVCLALNLGLTTASASDDADGYGMTDVGATAWLPDGWTSITWADWELIAESKDRSVRMKLWTTPFQVPPDEASGRAWADMVVAQYQSQGHTDVGIVAAGVRDQAGRPTAWATLQFKFAEDKGQSGVVHLRSIAGAGQVIHLTTLASARNSKAAETAADAVLDRLRLDKPPLDVSGDRVESAAGFAATLPTGWRAPLDPELGHVRKATSVVGEEKLDPDLCWSAVRPPPSGDKPDVIFACQLGVHLDPVDARSFADIETDLHTRFFGRSDNPVPAATPVNVGDRMGFYYRPPVKVEAVRLVLAPYNGGLMMIWGLGGHLDEPGLDAALTALLPTVQYTAPGGGHPVIGFDRRVAYYLKWNRTSPLVLGPAVLVLGLIGGAVAMSRRPKRDPLDD
jgi:hypothetical protein